MPRVISMQLANHRRFVLDALLLYHYTLSFYRLPQLEQSTHAQQLEVMRGQE